jgi:glycosyltransferase involved in cell wall biosynthesis
MDSVVVRQRSETLPAAADAAATTAHVKLAVVIPAYNEERAIHETVVKVRDALQDQPYSWEVVIVNDGSTDGTLAAAQSSGARVIDSVVNGGYGSALKAGITASSSDYVAIIDADGTYPAEQLPRMCEIAQGVDMVVGDRGAAMKNVPLLRRPAKWFLNSLANYLAERRIPDLNSGMRIFRRSALLPFVPLLPSGFSFTTTITMCMLSTHARVAYVPIAYGKRIGSSKIKPQDLFRFVLLVLRICMLFNPLRIFLPLGAVLFAIGAVKAVYDVFLMNLSESAVFAMLAAIIVWSLGLIADMISRLHLRP